MKEVKIRDIHIPARRIKKYTLLFRMHSAVNIPLREISDKVIDTLDNRKNDKARMRLAVVKWLMEKEL